MSSTSKSHKKDAPKALGFGVVIVSTSRSRKIEEGLSVTDLSGDLIEEHVVHAGHRVITRSIIPDDRGRILEWIESCLQDSQIDVIITCGGTGVGKSDVTIETVKEMIDKELPGFGGLFRVLSFEKIGSAAFVSRALAGISRRKVVFCVPGSPDAAELAMVKLVLPEVGHIVKHIRE
jgi:molybdenum cofactor biosynthesis protein B